MKTYTYSYQNGPCRGREAGEVPGQIRRRPQTPLTASAEAGKLGRVPGKLRRRPQTPRGLGKAQTSCFKVSDASESVKQVVSRFPTPRGVYGRRRIWPGTRRDPNARTTVGAYCIRPTKRARKGPNARNECTYRGGTFATDGGAR